METRATKNRRADALRASASVLVVAGSGTLVARAWTTGTVAVLCLSFVVAGVACFAPLWWSGRASTETAISSGVRVASLAGLCAIGVAGPQHSPTHLAASILLIAAAVVLCVLFLPRPFTAVQLLPRQEDRVIAAATVTLVTVCGQLAELPHVLSWTTLAFQACGYLTFVALSTQIDAISDGTGAAVVQRSPTARVGRMSRG